MPSAPLRCCAEPGCPALVPKGRCPAHAKAAWGSTTPTPRIRGRKLIRLRAELFVQEPFCRVCKVRLATIRDHIVPLAEGGADEPSNTQPLCLTCSDAKTVAESQRGRTRGRGGA